MYRQLGRLGTLRLKKNTTFKYILCEVHREISDNNDFNQVGIQRF